MLGTDSTKRNYVFANFYLLAVSDDFFRKVAGTEEASEKHLPHLVEGLTLLHNGLFATVVVEEPTEVLLNLPMRKVLLQPDSTVGVPP